MSIKFEWDDIDRKKFPYVLKKYRLLRGYTQEKLALKVGVLHTTISNYENGVSAPDYEILMLLAKYLRVDPGEFSVDWHLKDAKLADAVPEIIQVETDIINRKYTNVYATLPAGIKMTNLRAWLIPDEYLEEGDKALHIAMIAETDCINNGDTIVGIGDNYIPVIGKYSRDESGNENLESFTHFNKSYKSPYNLSNCASFKIVGKVISYITQEVNIPFEIL